MSNVIKIKVDELNALKPARLVENEAVEQKFVQIYNSVWGSDKGMQMYQKEAFNFQKLIYDNPALSECTNMSLYGCFLDMAVNGLSLDPTGKPHCYLIPRNVRSGHKDQYGKDIYEKRASVSVTGYGELVMRMRAGQIKYADNPVIVYEGDTFIPALENGKKVITYKADPNRSNTKIVGAFIRIVRNDGSEDYQWMLQPDIERLKTFSEKSNSYWDSTQKKRVTGNANALYTSNDGQIDPGFLENKMIKHAFDAYPKVRVGKYTQMETLDEKEPEIDYGIEDTTAEIISNGFDEEEPQTPEKPTVIVPESDEDEGF